MLAIPVSNRVHPTFTGGKVELLILTFMGFTSTGYTLQAEPPIQIYIDGHIVDLDTTPIIQNNRTLVPLRGIFEKLGATVDWNKETNQVIIKNKSIEVLLEAKHLTVLVNGVAKVLDVPATVSSNRTLVPVRFVAESLGCRVSWNPVAHSISITSPSSQDPVKSTSLPALGQWSTLKELLHYNNLLNTYLNNRLYTLTGIQVPVATTTDLKSDTIAAESTTASQTTNGLVSTPSVQNNASDYSGTNNQVAGVDEGDLVKTDGQSIFYLNQNTLAIIQATPTAPAISSTISIPYTRGTASDLYIENNHLILIGTNNRVFFTDASPNPTSTSLINTSASIGIMPPDTYTTSTFLLVYDVTDRKAPKLIKDMDFDGNYISSRLINNHLYMVTSWAFNNWAYTLETDQNNTLQNELKPSYFNNMTKAKTIIDYDQIHYFPDYIEANYMLTIGIDLSSNLVEVDAYLGTAQIVYVSENNLYMATTKYEYTTSTDKMLFVPNYDRRTVLYKFSLKQGQIQYVANTSVPGNIVNQYSLDEYDGNIRLTTTTGEPWNANDLSQNNLYILDQQLTQIGSLTNLAPGEKIYSTRFSGNRVYLVTFKQVDPFFVIDTTIPTQPKLLGELKLPGFSTYLHPLDENHVLGFGTDTVETDGRVTLGGFKLSLFDVTTPSAPIEESSQVIGTSGTYSEVSNNAKALMISLSKGLMTFPIQVTGHTPYVTDFIGAYVYDLSPSGFTFKTTLTHQSSQLSTDGSKYFDSNLNINRVLYIGDYLYSLSNGQLEVTQLSTLKTTSQLKLSLPDTSVPVPTTIK